MTFDELITEVKEVGQKVDTNGINFMAVQVNIKEGGVFYVEIKDGKVTGGRRHREGSGVLESSEEGETGLIRYLQTDIKVHCEGCGSMDPAPLFSGRECSCVKNHVSHKRLIIF